MDGCGLWFSYLFLFFFLFGLLRPAWDQPSPVWGHSEFDANIENIADTDINVVTGNYEYLSLCTDPIPHILLQTGAFY